MDIHELTNSGVDFVLSGKTFKIKRLSITEIFSDFEKEVKEDYMKNISQMALLIDEKNRIELIRKSMQDIPSGKRLDELAQEKMGSISGGLRILHKALNTCQQVSLEECIKLSDDTNSEGVSAIVTYALGQDKIEDVPDTKDKKK